MKEMSFGAVRGKFGPIKGATSDFSETASTGVPVLVAKEFDFSLAGVPKREA